MVTQSRPGIVVQPRWPRNLAAIALALLVLEWGWLGLAATPVLLALLVARLRWSGRHLSPPPGTDIQPIAAWLKWYYWSKFALLPERWAVCKCCAGIKDLWAIRRQERMQSEATQRARAAMQARQQAASAN